MIKAWEKIKAGKTEAVPKPGWDCNSRINGGVSRTPQAPAISILNIVLSTKPNPYIKKRSQRNQQKLTKVILNFSHFDTCGTVCGRQLIP